MMNRIALGAGWLLVTSGAFASSPDYLTHVKPVLRTHCYSCHGAAQQKSKLRLDTVGAMRAGGRHGPALVPGDAAASLIMRVTEGTHSSLPRMPYKRPVLSPEQIVVLRSWIAGGAQAPAAEQPDTGIHWSFIPPVRPAVPALMPDAPAGHNAIDAFIRRRLAQAGVTPSPEADRVTLLRRLSLDLTGLPPAPAEVDAFRRDGSPEAYARQVKRLLDSPHHGERWGRWWLDAARYADSNGYSIDAPRQIWKYRDWVIAALNRDLPFDQFAVWQLAGDLLPKATEEQLIATGFHRNTQINQEGGIDREQFRIDSVIDRVNTTGTAFLGLTIGCVQCHDHPFDPFPQKEFYQLFAFFNNCDEPALELPGEAEQAARANHDRAVAAAERELKALEQSLRERVSDGTAAPAPAARAKLAKEVQAILDTLVAARSAKQNDALFKALRDQDPELQKRAKDLAALKRRRPGVTSTMILREAAKPRRTYLFIKGDFTRDGGEVQPGVPGVLHPFPPDAPRNRLGFAQWLVDRRNPLLARVIVNRVWQQYFGAGLVETENDFGTQGAPPTHPELLDWLAVELMDHGWSLKHLHTVIVTSATYRQSSRARPELAAVDAANKLLARQNRLRLEAEVVRDVCLSVSGLLTPKIGGPGVYPPIPEGVMGLGQVRRAWTPDRDADRYRRGLYTFFYRATPHPALTVFDAPDGFSSCTRRIRSNTPLQALTLLNDQAHFEFAEALAARTRRAGATDAERIAAAFKLCVARAPEPAEQRALLRLLDEERAALASNKDAGEAAWLSVARVLLNLDETITRE